MKIIAYGIRDDELPYVQEWEKNNHIEIKTVSELLDEETVELATNYDVIVAYQQKDYTAGLIKKIHDLAINYLSIRNTGVDNVDGDAVNKYGLIVTNVPSYSPSAVAELSVAKLLELFRKTPQFNHKMQNNDFTWEPDISKEIRTQTIGVIGTGRIGQTAIRIFKAFGAKIIGYDIYQNPALKEEGIYVDSLDELYAKSTVITIHSPATEDNYHLLDDAAFNKMQNGVHILNMARGTLIDTDALIRALDSGKVAGAALDTLENETDYFNEKLTTSQVNGTFKNLLQRENVLITPHTAFYTEPAVRNMVIGALDASKDLIETGHSDKEVTFK
ncbi:D-2-hydroxyacid dehydrogenase [Dellaglioa sp. L3N]